MRLVLLSGFLLLAVLFSGCVRSNLPTDSPPTPTDIPATPTTETPVDTSISSWALNAEIPYGFEGTPNESMFIPAVESIKVDSSGGELRLKMSPADDLDCSQEFLIRWVFEPDVAVIHEGENITAVLQNPGGLTECYMNAKGRMYYGDDVHINLHVSGGSHFLSQPRYAPYQQQESQYLLVPLEDPGAIYPADTGLGPTAGNGMSTFQVKDGAAEFGTMDAKHGNFTIRIGAGGVFNYDITYLYDAIP